MGVWLEFLFWGSLAVAGTDLLIFLVSGCWDFGTDCPCDEYGEGCGAGGGGGGGFI